MSDTPPFPTDPYASFGAFLRGKGLRNTPQRNRIIEVFLQQKGHLTIEDLYDLVRHEDPSLGQATVYRTMKLLCGAGLARELRFGDGVICERCGKNIEVVDPDIEALQDALARKHGFTPTSHRLYLYGICSDCAQA